MSTPPRAARPEPGPRGPSPRGPRLAAAALTALQALVLAGLAVFYVVELVAGQGDDVARVVSSAVLIAVVAAGLAVLARFWLVRPTSARTPTLVWNALLVPVAIALFQAGQTLLAAGLSAVVVLSVVSAVLGGRPDGD